MTDGECKCLSRPTLAESALSPLVLLFPLVFSSRRTGVLRRLGWIEVRRRGWRLREHATFLYPKQTTGREGEPPSKQKNLPLAWIYQGKDAYTRGYGGRHFQQQISNPAGTAEEERALY